MGVGGRAGGRVAQAPSSLPKVPLSLARQPEAKQPSQAQAVFQQLPLFPSGACRSRLLCRDCMQVEPGLISKRGGIISVSSKVHTATTA